MGQPDSNPRIMDYNLFSVNLSTRMFRRSRMEMLLWPCIHRWLSGTLLETDQMEELYVEVPFHYVAMNVTDPVDYDRWRKWKMFTYFYHDPIYWSTSGGGGGGNRPSPQPPPLTQSSPWIFFGPSGLMGPIGPFSKPLFTVFNLIPTIQLIHGQIRKPSTLFYDAYAQGM